MKIGNFSRYLKCSTEDCCTNWEIISVASFIPFLIWNGMFFPGIPLHKCFSWILSGLISGKLEENSRRPHIRHFQSKTTFLAAQLFGSLRRQRNQSFWCAFNSTNSQKGGRTSTSVRNWVGRNAARTLKRFLHLNRLGTLHNLPPFGDVGLLFRKAPATITFSFIRR